VPFNGLLFSGFASRFAQATRLCIARGAFTRISVLCGGRGAEWNGAMLRRRMRHAAQQEARRWRAFDFGTDLVWSLAVQRRAIWRIFGNSQEF